MRRLVLVGLALVAAGAMADPNEQAIQRSLLKRDQQSADFNARLRGQSLEPLHQRQLQQFDSSTAPAPYDRGKFARERDAQMLRLPPPAAAPRGPDGPLPLPGGLPHVVDPIPVQGGGG